MKRQTQIYFDPRMRPNKIGFGGTLLKKGHAKVARSISTKHSTHLVLRSTKAKGKWSFLQPENRKAIHDLIYKFAEKYGVRIYSLSIEHNHIHLIIRITNRWTWKPFIRGLSSSIVMAVTGVTKLKELKESFWDNRPWTRIIDWGKAFWTAKRYVIMNELEAAGIIPYQARGVKRRLDILKPILSTA